ncbi:MAG: phage capsid protein [Rickettsia endosymbiont of Pentastiridius leporinus]
MEQITEALKEQFARNIGLVIQQEGSKLRKFVTNETQDTEVIQFETMHTHDRVGRQSLSYILCKLLRKQIKNYCKITT